MLQSEFDWFTIRKDSFHLLVEIVPFFVAPKVIDHEKPTVQQVERKLAISLSLCTTSRVPSIYRNG